MMPELSVVPAVQLSALRYLSICNHYSDTVMGVTDYLGLTKGTVSQSLKALEERQWIYKEPDLQDKRIVHLKPTAAGLAVVQQLVAVQVLQQAVQQLGPELEQQLTGALHQLLSQCAAATSSAKVLVSAKAVVSISSRTVCPFVV